MSCGGFFPLFSGWKVLGFQGEEANVGGCRKVFVSFGGLLLYMEGPYKNLTPLRIDYVYLCMKK